MPSKLRGLLCDTLLDREQLAMKGQLDHMDLMAVTAQMAAQDDMVSLEYLVSEVFQEELVPLGHQETQERVVLILKV
jgi:hypothetical protein